MSVELGIESYRLMARIRALEEELQRAYRQGLVNGPCHLAIGHEAIAAGVAHRLRPGDRTIGTYRGHAHCLARGVPIEAMMAEIFGRGTGLCGGKGGSMHLTSVAHGFYGCYAIVGAQLPVACGLAWASQVRGSGAVTVCFFGDGATNIGAFHEALNLAVVWRLPVVFVCENNLYMEYTPIEQMTAVARPAADRASAYGLAPIVIDGNDVEVVADVVGDAVTRARSGGGPSLVEAVTYRLTGHSAADPAKYRDRAEVSDAERNDPLARFRERLLERGERAEVLDGIVREAESEVVAARERAAAAPQPASESAFTDVWADGSSTWRN